MAPASAVIAAPAVVVPVPDAFVVSPSLVRSSSASDGVHLARCSTSAMGRMHLEMLRRDCLCCCEQQISFGGVVHSSSCSDRSTCVSGGATLHSQIAVAAAEALRRHIRTLLLRQQTRRGAILLLLLRQQRRCGVALADCCCGSRDLAASHSVTTVLTAQLQR